MSYLGDAAINLVLLDKSMTCTLEKFISLQRAQAKKSSEQLVALKNIVIDLVFESCAVCFPFLYLPLPRFIQHITVRSNF